MTSHRFPDVNRRPQTVRAAVAQPDLLAPASGILLGALLSLTAWAFLLVAVTAS